MRESIYNPNSSQLPVVSMATWAESVWLSSPEERMPFLWGIYNAWNEKWSTLTSGNTRYLTLQFVHSVDQAWAGQWHCCSVFFIPQSRQSLAAVSIIFWGLGGKLLGSGSLCHKLELTYIYKYTCTYTYTYTISRLLTRLRAISIGHIWVRQLVFIKLLIW